jgi:hypothetical protein
MAVCDGTYIIIKLNTYCIFITNLFVTRWKINFVWRIYYYRMANISTYWQKLTCFMHFKISFVVCYTNILFVVYDISIIACSYVLCTQWRVVRNRICCRILSFCRTGVEQCLVNVHLVESVSGFYDWNLFSSNNFLFYNKEHQLAQIFHAKFYVFLCAFLSHVLRYYLIKISNFHGVNFRWRS